MDINDLNKKLAAKNHKLKKELNLFKMSIENAQHLFFITDTSGKIIYANPAFINFTGYNHDEVIGKRPDILKSGEMPDTYYKKLWETVKSGTSWQEEIINKKKNGERYYAFQIITPIKGANGKIENFVSIQHDVTEEKENQQKLQEILSEYNTIFNNTLDAIFLINIDKNNNFRFSRLNPTHEKLTGLTTKNIKNKTPEEVLGEELGAQISENYKKCLKAQKPIDYEEILDLPGGKKIWKTRLTPVFYGNEVKEIIGTSREITREKELSKERDMFFEVSLDMICIATTNGYFKQLSPMWSKTLGWSEEELKSRPYIEFIHPDDVEKTKKTALHLLEGKNTNSFENRFLKKDNTYNWLSWNAFADKEDGLIYAVARDIEQQKKTEQELIRMSQTDQMLKISNRSNFLSILKSEIKRQKRYDSKFSIVMFDIDHFKSINDNFGHDIGDSVLKELTSRISNALRETDTFARWGGEEFMVLLSETEKKGALCIAERLRSIVADKPFKTAGKVTISLGVAVFNEKDTEDKFLKRADEALYLAKSNGRNRIEFISAYL